MEEFFSTISLHTPIFAGEWNVATVISIAIGAGLLLALYCRVTFGAYFVWGFMVGMLGALFLWLVIAVIPLKWAILVVAAMVLLIGAGFYIDEQSRVTAAELVDAAAERNPYLLALFERDPEAAESITETLNLGLDDAEPIWPPESHLAGISKRVTQNVRYMLTYGFALLGVMALLIHFAIPSKSDLTKVLTT